MWTIEEGLELIRQMQRALKPLGFHVALAGGVLNTGKSLKDLDLVFLPLTHDEAPDVEQLVDYVKAFIGVVTIDPEEMPSHKPNPYSPYRHQEALHTLDDNRRIDIFVV